MNLLAMSDSDFDNWMPRTTSQPPGDPLQKAAHTSRGFLLGSASWSGAPAFESRTVPRTFRRRGQLSHPPTSCVTG